MPGKRKRVSIKSSSRSKSTRRSLAAYRSGLRRLPLWRVGRDTRRFEFNAISCWETSSASALSGFVQGALSQNFVFAPRLGDFPSASDFVSTYDSYKVLSVELWFQPQYDPVNALLSAPATQQAEWIKSIIDINDSTVLSGTLYEQAPSFMATCVGKPFCRRWQPAFISSTPTGANMINDQKDSWLSVSASGALVPQLACKVFCPPYVNIASYVLYTLKVRMVVIGRSQG